MSDKDTVLNEVNLSRWLNEKEVSCLTKMSLSTLRAHRFYRKGLPYTKIGRSVRYRLADIVSFMEAHRVVPKSI